MNLDDARALTLADVTVAIGLALDDAGRTLSPCPSCGAEQRGTRDRRTPVGLTADRAGWRCHRCGAGGSAIDLVGYHLTGRRPKPGDRATWSAVLSWCDSHFGAGQPRVTKRRRGRCRSQGAAIESPQPTRPRPRPPIDEVCALRNACRAVTDDRAVATWLAIRGLDPMVVDALDLARALPPGVPLPEWARCAGHPWSEGWRCILPVYDHAGDLVTVRARWVESRGAPRGVKVSAAAAGPDSAGGAVLSCLYGHTVLRTGRAPSHWPVGEPLRIVVAEGETDWLAWRLALHADTLTRRGAAAATREHGRAIVWGVWAGAWTDEIARRVPDGTLVHIRTDQDAPGDKYAETIRRSLAGRCDVRREARSPTDAA